MEQMAKLFFNSLAAIREVLLCKLMFYISVYYYANTGVNKDNGGDNDNTYRLSKCGCTGVEKKLIECPRYLQLDKHNCQNDKVTVLCNSEF